MDKYLLICRRYYSLLLLIIIIDISKCIEEAAPEVLLSPRNFNPHPYETMGNIQATSGPVLFPVNPEDEEEEKRNNIITIPRQSKNNHPVDSHPYSKVAKKNRYRLVGKYHNNEDPISPKIIKALGVHAAKILRRPSQQLEKEYIPIPIVDDINQRMNYAFSYKVVDHLTGDDFSHRQSQTSKATKGEYRVKLPDGRIQIVSYTADKNGYKAEVKYTEDNQDNRIQNRDVQIQKIPVREIKPVPKEHIYDYYEEVLPVKNQIIYVTQAPPINNHKLIALAPQEVYVGKNLHPKVQIITTNPRDYSTGTYIPSGVALYSQAPTVTTTPAPYYDVKHNFVSSTISPLIINNGDHGHIIPKAHNSDYDGGYGHFLVTTVAPTTVNSKDILLDAAQYRLIKSHPVVDYSYKKK